MLRFVLPLCLIALPALAEQPYAGQPYAGLQHRDIKALSAEDIADLKAGRGWGLALAAELNGYPGPAHVLELAAPLELSEAQRAEAQVLYDAMLAETRPLGERLIAEEAALDRLFAERRATAAAVDAATAAIGTTTGRLRAAHLRYHLATLDLLSPHQVHQYAALRGYADGQAGQGAGGHGAGHQHMHPKN